MKNKKPYYRIKKKSIISLSGYHLLPLKYLEIIEFIEIIHQNIETARLADPYLSKTNQIITYQGKNNNIIAYITKQENLNTQGRIR